MSIYRSPASKALSIFVTIFLCAASFGTPAHAADLSIYGDSLSPGWADWSWGSTRNFAATSPAKSGTHSLAVTITAGWGALYLHSSQSIDLNEYDTLRFWIHGGTSGGQNIRVVANGATGAAYPLTVPPGAWSQIDVPLSSLGNPSALDELQWQDTSGGAQPAFYLDDIALIEGNSPPPPPGTGPSIIIDTSLDRHVISDYIYGMNFADEALATELRLPVNRRGGNSMSRYNWQIDVYNTANDWFFENITEPHTSPSPLPDDSSADLFVEQDERSGAKSILTIPMIGWVAKQRISSHPYNCGFSVKKYGTQTKTDSEWDADCGNGIAVNGTNITGNDPTDTSVASTPTFVSNWINHLTGRYGTASNGGVAYYNLDNEPMLWNSTHRDVHPQPVSYDEIRDRTYQYAPVIKAADPTALTLGPVLWGWCAYFYSAKDDCGASKIDFNTHGNTYFVPWYLQQMKAYQDTHSVRILDYLDLHYYPQATDVSLNPAGDSGIQSLRLRSTRGLWDPTYTDESWIGDTVHLIPRMKEWVNTNYPGTKLAITEYNWGGLEHINGALAQADVLGIFGREGLDLATIWGPPAASQPGAYAFRMYRNYDSAGHAFGDIGIRAMSSNQDKVSVYGAQRSTDKALTLIFINKTANDLTTPVTLTGTILPASAAVYRYSSAALNVIQHPEDLILGANGFTTTFPANSITLLEIPQVKFILDITVTGSGTGTVTSAPSGISCTSLSTNGCSSSFSLGSTVKLLATPGTGSVFSGWGGACSGMYPCSIAMDTPYGASATFMAAPDVRIGTSSYLTLQDAYDAATTSDSIMLQEGSRGGALLANRNIEITIKGGYNSTYPPPSVGQTSLEGGMTINNGAVRFERISIH
jgi:hypothetical protein